MEQPLRPKKISLFLVVRHTLKIPSNPKIVFGIFNNAHSHGWENSMTATYTMSFLVRHTLFSAFLTMHTLMAGKIL